MPKSVLVADDSLTIRKVIGMLFHTEDFAVTMVVVSFVMFVLLPRAMTSELWFFVLSQSLLRAAV